MLSFFNKVCLVLGLEEIAKELLFDLAGRLAVRIGNDGQNRTVCVAGQSDFHAVVYLKDVLRGQSKSALQPKIGMEIAQGARNAILLGQGAHKRGQRRCSFDFPVNKRG